MRRDGRDFNQPRATVITPNFIDSADGNALIEVGGTRVLCSATLDTSLPAWLRNDSKKQGWLTAEYSMLPTATSVRTRRERNHVGGRTQEIQRLIGRSLRGVLNLRKMPELMIHIDCDVLRADAGTRTASITGSYVALGLAVAKALKQGLIKSSPLVDSVCAVSVGLNEQELLLDLDYSEDSTVSTDMNVVMTGAGKLLEVQGTAEKSAFTPEQLLDAVKVADRVRAEYTAAQELAIKGEVASCFA